MSNRPLDEYNYYLNNPDKINHLPTEAAIYWGRVIHFENRNDQQNNQPKEINVKN